MGCARQVVWRTALLVAVLMFAILGSASPGVARVSPSPDAPEQRKYYVVRPSDSLYRIAVETLGDGNRYREIFALSSGREQADGGRMTDPMTLRPGWVLVLPADARGPGVLAPSASPSTTPIPSASPRQETMPAPVPVLVAVAVFVALAFLALWTSVSPVRRAAVTRTVRGGRDRSLRQVGRLRGLGGTARQIVSHLSRGRTVPAGTSESGGPAAASPEEDLPPLTATLVTECGPIGVELGARARGGRPFYRWLGVFDPAPESFLPVVLGLHEGSRLFVDLADCPDPFTIAGNVRDCRRYAAGLAGQLLAHGRFVQVVGDVLGVDEPDGCERLTTMPTLTGPSSRDRTRVVITAGLRGRSLADLRRCFRDDDRGVAVIVIGDVLRSRWSASLPPRGAAAEGAPGPAATAGATP